MTTDLSNIPQFQRYETSHRLLLNDFNQIKVKFYTLFIKRINFNFSNSNQDEVFDLKKTIHDLTEENKK